MKVGLPGTDTVGRLPVEEHVDISVGITGQVLRVHKHGVDLAFIIRVVVDDNVREIALQDDVGGGDQLFVLIGDVEFGTVADRELPVQRQAAAYVQQGVFPDHYAAAVLDVQISDAQLASARA